MAANQQSYQLYKRYVKNIALIYNRRKDIRTYIELMLSISVIVIFGLFALRPTFVTIVELRANIKDKEKTLELLNKKINDLDAAQNVWNENRTQLTLLNSAVPDGPLPAVYARQIEGLAKRHNTLLFRLNVESVTILGAAAEKDLEAEDVDPEVTDRYPQDADSLEFSFDIYGDYNNILNFISELEKLRRPLFIDNMTIQADEETGGQVVIVTVLGRSPYIIE